jgi:hypothetical protein
LSPSQRKPMITNLRPIFHLLAKLLALPWRLATYQLQPPGPVQRRQGGSVVAEEDVEMGLYLLR